MGRTGLGSALLVGLVVVGSVLLGRPCSAQAAVGLEGFAEVNGVRLQYLDWGGSGEWLILIHGLGDNPHAFDDFAPALKDHFHVIAYARRGSGGSDAKGPYDAATLAEDLRGLMDALGIAQANLVGYSAAGAEVTEMATAHPERVRRVVYFEGGYDGADPDASALVQALPQGFFDPPAPALRSLDAFRAYQKTTQYVDLDDMRRIEANLRQKVIVQADGTLRFRIPKEVVGALYSAMLNDKRRDYSRIRCPVLALYAQTLYNLRVADPVRRKRLTDFEHQYWAPFQAKSIAQLRRQLPGARIVHVPGTHDSFYLTARSQVVGTTRDFLLSAQQ